MRADLPCRGSSSLIASGDRSLKLFRAAKVRQADGDLTLRRHSRTLHYAYEA